MVYRDLRAIQPRRCLHPVPPLRPQATQLKRKQSVKARGDGNQDTKETRPSKHSWTSVQLNSETEAVRTGPADVCNRVLELQG